MKVNKTNNSNRLDVGRAEKPPRNQIDLKRTQITQIEINITNEEEKITQMA